jgi:hypothetical protein
MEADRHGAPRGGSPRVDPPGEIFGRAGQRCPIHGDRGDEEGGGAMTRQVRCVMSERRVEAGCVSEEDTPMVVKVHEARRESEAVEIEGERVGRKGRIGRQLGEDAPLLEEERPFGGAIRLRIEQLGAAEQ